MIKVCVTSGCKGGTGKSTISTLLTVLYAGVEKRVILIDTGTKGNCSHIILNNPPPPYLGDVILPGNITEAILKCEMAIGDRNVNFYLIPNNGQLPEVSSETIERSFRKIEKYFDIAILDIPAYQNEEYYSFIDVCDIAVLVYNPNRLIINSVSKAYTGKCVTVPVLNKYLGIEKYRNLIKEIHGKCLVVPFDPYLSLLSPENLVNALLNLSRKTQEVLVELALEVLKPYIGSRRREPVRSFLKIGTVLRR